MQQNANKAAEEYDAYVDEQRHGMRLEAALLRRVHGREL